MNQVRVLLYPDLCNEYEKTAYTAEYSILRAQVFLLHTGKLQI